MILGISTIVYAAARGQDIVGRDVTFTFGWSCVTSWIATIVALLNTIITLVMICVYIDKLTERVNRVREDLGMDTLSIRSTSLQRINEHLDGLGDVETAPDTNIEINVQTPSINGNIDSLELVTLSIRSTSLQKINKHLDAVESGENITDFNEEERTKIHSSRVGAGESITDADGEKPKTHSNRVVEKNIITDSDKQIS